MSKFSILIGTEYLDIPAGAGIAFDVAGNDFGELNTRQGVKSSDFNVPATSKNKRLLSSSGRISAELFLKNQSISIGFVQVVEEIFKGKVIKIAYYGTNSDWLVLIDGLTLRDLELSRYSHDYNLTNILAGLTQTEGFCYPMINYGRLTERTTREININDQELYPAIFIPVILRQIFTDQRIKIEGTIFQDPLFNTIMIPYSGVNSQRPSETFNRIEATLTGKVLSTTGGGFFPNLLGGSTLVLGNAAYYDVDSGRLSNVSTYGPIFFDYSFDIDITNLTTTIIIQRTIYDADGNIDDFNTIVNTSSNGNFTGSEFSLEIPVGGYVDFLYDNGNTGTTIDFDITYESETTKMVTKNCLPDMFQKDFIKWIVTTFGILINFNDVENTITFNLSDQLYGKLDEALNWTPKLDMSQERTQNFIDFIQNYAQNNRFAYGGDDEGEGFLTVSNNTLPSEQDYYQAPFDGTLRLPAFSLYSGQVVMPFIDVFSDTDDLEPDSDANPRVLTQDIDSGRTSITLTDDNTSNVVTEYDSPRFSTLYYSVLIPEYYASISKIINNGQSFEVFLRLNGVNIREFNQENIIRIESRDFIGYFYVSKIEDYNGEDLSYKATLLKL